MDGYSLLHRWLALAPGQPRHSMAAREELIAVLTQYRDAALTPLTVVFDGGGAPRGTAKAHSTPELEIFYSKAGQTADDIIERVTHRLKPYGEVLVVTDDFAERDTVIALGGSATSCEQFIMQIGAVLSELQRDLRRVNERESRGFNRQRPG